MTSLLSIVGTSRKIGNTNRILNRIHEKCMGECIHLSSLSCHPYDYAQEYEEGDDFLAVVDRMLQVDTLLFATPVYWYSMSAQLKVFFDRFSDLLNKQKEKGRSLAGKRMFMLATGSDELLPEGFTVPFERTAQYFDMEFVKALYVPFTGETARITEGEFDSFIQHLKTTSEVKCNDGICQLLSEESWAEAFEVLSTLRPKLDRTAFLKRRVTLQQQGYRLYGLYRNAELFCIGGISFHPHVEREKDLWVHDLVTSPKQRSKGCGKEMMRFLEGRAHEETGHALSVYTRTSREHAIHFYETKLAYTRTSLLFKSS